jgi:hypothetical protein
MRTVALASVLLVALFATGCATKDNIYYWGDYSETLYDLKKNPDEKTLKAHTDQLLLIINEAPNRHKRVPPGVYGEYGYILLKQGKKAEGMEYLDKELGLYPESAVFINRIRSEYARGKK